MLISEVVIYVLKLWLGSHQWNAKLADDYEFTKPKVITKERVRCEEEFGGGEIS